MKMIKEFFTIGFFVMLGMIIYSYFNGDLNRFGKNMKQFIKEQVYSITENISKNRDPHIGNENDTIEK